MLELKALYLLIYGWMDITPTLLSWKRDGQTMSFVDIAFFCGEANQSEKYLTE